MNFLKIFHKNNQERIVGLDILRSIAILTVVYEHGSILIPKEGSDIYERINFIKIDGVSIFFVLSGFLIGGILLKIIKNSEFTTKDLLNFWVRRWFRTIPNYLFVLLFLLAFRVLFFKSDLQDFSFKYFFFTQNFIFTHPNFFPEAWSLAVEEWFYFLFPIFCFLISRIHKSKSSPILISALIFLTIPLILRVLKYEQGIGIDDFDRNFRKVMLLRLDGLIYGIVGAYLSFKIPNLWVKYKNQLLLIGLFIIAILNFNPSSLKDLYYPISFNIESFTTLLFLPFLSSLKSTRFTIIDNIFYFISIISYSIYLLNLTPVIGHLLPITRYVLNEAGYSINGYVVINYLFYLFYTISGSYLLYTLFEQKMTRLRDKIKI